MNSLEMFQARMLRVFPNLRSLSPLLEKRFLNPYRSITFPDIPFERNNRKVDNLSAWLTFWWNPWGSAAKAKGGVRLDPDATEDETATLAGLMFVKLEVMGIPWGGAKFCIKEPMPRLAPDERKRAIRSAISAIKRYIGTSYLPGPDLGTGDLIGVMVDEFAKNNPHPWLDPIAVFTGKPEELLGLRIRRESTGIGGIYGIEYLMAERMTGGIRTLASSRIACQGFGQVIQPFAEYAAKYRNARIVAVNDISCTLYRSDGIDIAALREAMRGPRVLAGIPFDGDRLPPDALFQIPSDILILGAKENQLTAERARSIEAKLVAELANFPTTYDAEDILNQRDIAVIPDAYLNGGGVSVSYDEARNGNHWGDEDEIEKQLKKAMHAAGQHMARIAQKHKYERLRDAAYQIAAERAIARHKARGADFKEEGI